MKCICRSVVSKQNLRLILLNPTLSQNVGDRMMNFLEIINKYKKEQTFFFIEIIGKDEHSVYILWTRSDRSVRVIRCCFGKFDIVHRSFDCLRFRLWRKWSPKSMSDGLVGGEIDAE